MKTAAERSPLLTTPEPPELGPGPRATVQPLPTLTRQIDEALSRAKLAGAGGELVRALVLLWHDHLEAAHVLAQTSETADGSYIHALVHRREPDYGNARYWFRRVSQHACYHELAARVATLLKSKQEPELEAKLIPGGRWDAFAFVDVCEKAAGGGAEDRLFHLLREIQRVEFEVLLDYLFGKA